MPCCSQRAYNRLEMPASSGRSDAAKWHIIQRRVRSLWISAWQENKWFAESE
jgi:hypothetical protein